MGGARGREAVEIPGQTVEATEDQTPPEEMDLFAKRGG
jgi:hypothetical protein